MGNLRIRAYNKGDEDLIKPHELMVDWDDENSRSSLETGENYTIVDDSGVIQAVVNVTPMHGNMLYGWFLRDRDANPLFLKKVKKILKNYLQNGFIVCTISKDGEMQDRMHRYLGFDCIEQTGGLKTWVSRLKT